MRCEEAGIQLPAYLLDELTPEERASVEGHLSSCTSCARELDGLRQIGDLVADAHLDARPPAALKDETFRRLQSEDLGVLLGATAAATPPPDLKHRAMARALTDDRSASGTKKRRRPRASWLAAAAAIAGIGIAATSQMRVQDLDRQLATMEASVQRVEESFGPVGHPMQAVQLAGRGAEAEAELVHFEHDNYRMTVKLGEIEVTPPDHHYEMWLAGDEGQVSVGSFRIKRPDDMTLTFTTGVDPGEFPEVAITLERSDGDPAMSSDLVATAQLDRDAIYHGPYEE